MNSTHTNGHSRLDLLAAIQKMDATSCEGLMEVEVLVASALWHDLPPALAAVLDSVQFLVQRIANDINATAESVGADCRLALG